MANNNVLYVDLSLAKSNQEFKELKKEIERNICALLNSNGGKLVLTTSKDTDMTDALKKIKPYEQYFRSVIGVYPVHKYFEILQEGNTITFVVSGLPSLCTLRTNLYLPADRQMLLLPGTERGTLCKILFESRIVEISKNEMPEQFRYGHTTNLHESKSVQFKNIKAKRKGRKDFVSRAIDNKFTDYISGFANTSGGMIFYGIQDDGTVVGELLPNAEKDCEEIPRKLEREVKKMIWPKESGEINRGKQWDVKFFPVTNCDANEKRFVIVVSVFPCSGGVFTKEPESYYIEKKDEVKTGQAKKRKTEKGQVNKASRMNFETWKINMYYKVSKPKEMNRNNWSSKQNEKEYMRNTQELEELRQRAGWKKIISKYEESLNTSDVNTKLVYLLQVIAVYYRRHQFEIAMNHLHEFRDMMSQTEDSSVFDVEERYFASAIERSRGGYRKAWDIIKEGLPKADMAPVGLVPASFYANAASVLSKLVQDKSFIDENKDKDFVKNAKRLCDMALQHLVYFKDEFKIVKEDLEQKLNITLALLCLKSAGEDLAFDSDLKTAEDKIKDVEMSFEKLEQEGIVFKFNYCRLLLAKSQLHSELAKRCLKKANVL